MNTGKKSGEGRESYGDRKVNREGITRGSRQRGGRGGDREEEAERWIWFLTLFGVGGGGEQVPS